MRRSARVAWIVCGLSLAVMALSAGVQVATWSVQVESFAPRGAALPVYPIVVIVGALIVSRVAGNAIGRLFLYAGAVGAVQCLSEQLAYAAVAWPAMAGLAPWAHLAYTSVAATNPSLITLIVPAVFPSGRLSMARDRRAVVIGCVAIIVIAAMIPMTVERFPIPFPTLNPLARPELAVTGWVITLVAGAMYAAALGIILVGVVQRFRRSRGIERQQLKWFAYGASIVGSAHGSLAILLIVLYLTMGKGFLDAPPTALRAWVLGDIAAFAAPPVAVAFAILRYRLYDIDILINRTVLYVSVTAILAAAFAILSTASQRAMEAITGQRSDTLSIALALALALGFAPLRRRIQPLVDQALPGRGVLTLLFTDIVGSTERIVALGDDRWRSVLDAYRAAVRRELTRFGGREVDTAGDGFFATFERPTQAVRCAGALRESLHDIGLDSRIGLHTGECEMRGERVSGLNVVVAARIMATARANEIVASSAVCELVGGSGFRCRDGRVESLKGVPGEWRLHFVDAPVAMAR